MPLPADPVGRAFAQQMLRDQYERWLYDEVIAILEGGFKDVATTLITEYDDLSVGQKRRLARLFSEISEQLQDAYGEARTTMTTQVRELAGIEGDVARAHVEALIAESKKANVTIASLSRTQVRAIATMPIAGLNVGEWFEKQANDMNLATRRQIQMGLLQGEPSAAIVRRILPGRIPTAAAGEPPPSASVVMQARRSTTALVRTTVTAVSNEAALRGYIEAGPDVSDSYTYVAVRDSRTTPICRALDGRVYKYSDPKRRMPPQHVNCRSTIRANVNYKKLGLPKPDETKLTYGSYAKWLGEQNESTQNAILGKAGATLFRSGKAELPDLVRRDGRRLTIEQLKRKYGV